jgi:hypothetical protein
MKVTISYDKQQNFQRGNELICNLEDLAVSLDKNLRRHHNASSTATFLPGRLELMVTGSDQDTVKPYLDAFQKAMIIRLKFRVMISYT